MRIKLIFDRPLQFSWDLFFDQSVYALFNVTLQVIFDGKNGENAMCCFYRAILKQCFDHISHVWLSLYLKEFVMLRPQIFWV